MYLLFFHVNSPGAIHVVLYSSDLFVCQLKIPHNSALMELFAIMEICTKDRDLLSDGIFIVHSTKFHHLLIQYATVSQSTHKVTHLCNDSLPCFQ